MDHRYHNEEHEDKYERSSYSERYKNTDLLKWRKGENMDSVMEALAFSCSMQINDFLL